MRPIIDVPDALKIFQDTDGDYYTDYHTTTVNQLNSAYDNLVVAISEALTSRGAVVRHNSILDAMCNVDWSH